LAKLPISACEWQTAFARVRAHQSSIVSVRPLIAGAVLFIALRDPV